MFGGGQEGGVLSLEYLGECRPKSGRHRAIRCKYALLLRRRLRAFRFYPFYVCRSEDDSYLSSPIREDLSRWRMAGSFRFNRATYPDIII